MCGLTKRFGGILDDHRLDCVVVPGMAAGMLCASMMAVSADPTAIQSYPSKPVRLIASEPGGGNDFAARVIAREFSARLGQQMIVDNRGGASGIGAAQIVARASPDGYTLLIYGTALWTAVLMVDNLPYDPIRDFSPITLVTSSPNILIVNPAIPVKSVHELISVVRARPGELNYSSSGPGSSNHLAAELFNAMAGIKMVRIPYKGSGLALNALIAGEVQIMFPNAASVTPYMKSGKLRALAVTSTQPSPLAPGLPTLASSGLPGYESVVKVGMFAPAKTPASLISRLNQEIVRILNEADVKERVFKTGVEAVGTTPGEFSMMVKAEMARMGKVIKDAGIREQ